MPEYGDPDNSRSWDNANVYIAFDDGSGFAADPATIDDEFGAGWDLVGLLDGQQGFTEATSETVTNTSAWGNVQIASKTTDQVTTKTFTAYETNDTTDRLLHIEEGIQYRRAPERVKIAFENVDQGRSVTERRISYYQAEVRQNGDLTDNETAPKSIPFIATIFPGTSAELWTIQRAEVGS